MGERRLSVESLYSTCPNPTTEPNNSIQKARRPHLTGRTPSPLPILRNNFRRQYEGKLIENDNRCDGGYTSEVNISETDTRTTTYNDIASKSGNSVHQPSLSSNCRKSSDTKAVANAMWIPEKQDYRCIKNSSSSKEDARHNYSLNSAALDNLRAGITQYTPIMGKSYLSLEEASGRGSKHENLMLIEM